MDQEFYEWIRLDCNFEWFCFMKMDMFLYMIVVQLQQDRDVVVQQDLMFYFCRVLRFSGVVFIIEIWMVMDCWYYYGICCMVIEDFLKMVDLELNYIGKVYLILIFWYFFCDCMVGKNGVVIFLFMLNDFSDKVQYYVQCVMVLVIVKMRENGWCLKDVWNFLFDLFFFNDNFENDYLDYFYVVCLL